MICGIYKQQDPAKHDSETESPEVDRRCVVQGIYYGSFKDQYGLYKEYAMVHVKIIFCLLQDGCRHFSDAHAASDCPGFGEYRLQLLAQENESEGLAKVLAEAGRAVADGFSNNLELGQFRKRVFRTVQERLWDGSGQQLWFGVWFGRGLHLRTSSA